LYNRAEQKGARDFLGKEIIVTNFINMIRDESGASAAEYALILAIVGAGIALAAYTLGRNISNAMGAVGTKIGTCTAATPTSSPSGC